MGIKSTSASGASACTTVAIAGTGTITASSLATGTLTSSTRGSALNTIAITIGECVGTVFITHSEMGLARLLLNLVTITLLRRLIDHVADHAAQAIHHSLGLIHRLLFHNWHRLIHRHICCLLRADSPGEQE
jgi:hypothetical protein